MYININVDELSSSNIDEVLRVATTQSLIDELNTRNITIDEFLSSMLGRKISILDVLKIEKFIEKMDSLELKDV